MSSYRWTDRHKQICQMSQFWQGSPDFGPIVPLSHPGHCQLYSSFLIFQIGPLLRKIWPKNWSKVIFQRYSKSPAKVCDNLYIYSLIRLTMVPKGIQFRVACATMLFRTSQRFQRLPHVSVPLSTGGYLDIQNLPLKYVITFKYLYSLRERLFITGRGGLVNLDQGFQKNYNSRRAKNYNPSATCIEVLVLVNSRM